MRARKLDSATRPSSKENRYEAAAKNPGVIGRSGPVRDLAPGGDASKVEQEIKITAYPVIPAWWTNNTPPLIPTGIAEQDDRHEYNPEAVAVCDSKDLLPLFGRRRHVGIDLEGFRAGMFLVTGITDENRIRAEVCDLS